VRYFLILLLLLNIGCKPIAGHQLATGALDKQIVVELEGRTYSFLPLKEENNWMITPITALNEGKGYLRPISSSERSASIKALEIGTGCNVDIASVLHEATFSTTSVTC